MPFIPVTITTLPADNGAAITDIKYDVDASGTFISSGGTTDFNATVPTTGEHGIRIRAVNSVGDGAISSSKSSVGTESGPAFISTYTSNTLTTVQTTSAFSIGTADAGRWCIIAFSNNNNDNVTGVTIGVENASLLGKANGSGGSVYFYAANVTTGTTAVVEITTSANTNNWAVHMWTADSPTFGTASVHNNNVNPHNTNVNTSASDSVLGCSMALDDTAYDAADITATGLSVVSEGIVALRGSVAAQADGVAAETPRTIQWTYVGGSLNKFRSAALTVS